MRWRPTASFDPSGDHRKFPTVAPENLMSLVDHAHTAFAQNFEKPIV
jgi:hypothetical protein